MLFAYSRANLFNSVQFVEADVSSWDDLVNGFEVAISNAPTQSIDIVITAAGLRSQYVPHWLRAQSLDGTKPTKPDMRCLDVNLSGTYMTAYLALHYFRRSVQDGLSNTLSKQIVFVGSLAGYGTSACYANYAASKYGVRGMWRALREECDILGYPGTKSTFRTSMLAPWYVETSMIKDMQAVIRQAGVPIATTEDCVDALMRIICDEGVHGRAVAVAPNGRSFDLCDDAEGLDAGRDYNESFKNGTYGADLATLMAMFVNLRMTEDHRAG